jgi:chemotaxis signal transduction protein
MHVTLVPDDYPLEAPQSVPEQHALQGAAALSAAREGHELMLAQAGSWHIGLFAEEVETIAAWRTPIPLPYAPPAVLGVVSVRSRMLTVIDPATLLGEGSETRAKAKAAAHAFIIVLKGDEQLALAVSRVDGYLGIFLSELVASSTGLNSNVVRGVIQGAHGQTTVLDARELFMAAMQGAERRRQRF